MGSGIRVRHPAVARRAGTDDKYRGDFRAHSGRGDVAAVAISIRLPSVVRSTFGLPHPTRVRYSLGMAGRPEARISVPRLAAARAPGARGVPVWCRGVPVPVAANAMTINLFHAVQLSSRYRPRPASPASRAATGLP